MAFDYLKDCNSSQLRMVLVSRNHRFTVFFFWGGRGVYIGVLSSGRGKIRNNKIEKGNSI